MREQTMRELQDQIARQQTEMEVLKQAQMQMFTVAKETNAHLKDLAKSLSEYTTKLAVSDERLKATDKRFDEVVAIQGEHIKFVARANPVLESLRSLSNKMLFGVIGVIVASNALSSALVAFMQKGG